MILAALEAGSRCYCPMRSGGGSQLLVQHHFSVAAAPLQELYPSLPINALGHCPYAGERAPLTCCTLSLFQAELRALEEGDGSVSGSSPLSDGSQCASQDVMRRQASKRGKWKLFVGAGSPESTSRGSSKTGRESPETGEAGNLTTF